jgi:hypothetical protein
MPQGKRPTPRQATRRAGRAAGSGVHPDVAGPVPPGPFRCPRSRDDGRGRFRQQDLGWDIRGTSEYGPSASPAPASPPIRTPRPGRGAVDGTAPAPTDAFKGAGHGRRDAVKTGASARCASPTRFATARQVGICPAWTPPKRDGYSAEPPCFHGLPGCHLSDMVPGDLGGGDIPRPPNTPFGQRRQRQAGIRRLIRHRRNLARAQPFLVTRGPGAMASHEPKN